jgi:hypothetical protein
MGVYFSAAIFTQRALFLKTTFSQSSEFVGAAFTQNAFFGRAIFTQSANFNAANFAHDANFYRTIFAQDVGFRGAIFTQAAKFMEATFFGTASWMNSRFLENAEFRHTAFSPKVACAPSAVFALAYFDKPGRIVFDDLDLGRALCHDCDVSEVWFTSSVRWGGGSGNREFQVFEETIPLDQEGAEGLKSNGDRDYGAIAQIYQQLKKNYDTRLDYWKANQFHFGEMEMKRRALPTQGRLLGLRRWIHPCLSPVALYRWGSDYGNNYWKPMIWLLGFLLIFASLFPMPGVGLQRSEPRTRETYSSVWRAGSSAQQSIRWEVGLWGKSLLTAVDTATFQKGVEYAPAYPWGRVLAIAETLLTSTLFALFLLALRRQFRR